MWLAVAKVEYIPVEVNLLQWYFHVHNTKKEPQDISILRILRMARPLVTLNSSVS